MGEGSCEGGLASGARLARPRVSTNVPYFDHNATAPLHPAARAAWLEAADRFWANPSSLYKQATAARDLLADCRERLADILGCSDPGRIVFTAGATAANNLLARHLAAVSPPGSIALISPLEHPAVDASIRAAFPGRVHETGVDAEGVVRPEELARAIDTATAMAERLDDQVARVNVLAKIGEVYGGREAGLGDAAKAQKVLAQAAELAAGEDISDRFRPQALAAVALGYANANLAGDANAVTEKLESLAASLQDLRPKAEALAAAANVRAKSGAKEKATALLAEAAKAAKAIDGSANKTFALLAVARAMKAAGDTAGATALAAEAEKTSAKIGDPEQQKEALQEVRALQAALKS